MSLRKSEKEEIGSDEAFESADDSEAQDIKRDGSKNGSSKAVLPSTSTFNRPQNFSDMAKQATIQEIQETLEVDEETVIKPSSPVDEKSNKIRNELSKITEDFKGGENDENIEFMSEGNPTKRYKFIQLPIIYLICRLQR